MSAPSPAPPPGRIPVVVLTGFLGAGKTSLLARALADPTAAGTLAIVNEIGAVGLDQHLLQVGGGQPQLIENGCLCCSASDDLVTLLEGLFWQRLERRIPRFARVVIETTGLADPRPIVSALRGTPLLAERYAYAGAVTVIDAGAGLAQLSAQPEAAVQVAMADRLVLSKTDLAPGRSLVPLQARLAALNPLAPVGTAPDAATAAALLCGFDRGESAFQHFPGLDALPRAAGPGHLADVTLLALPLRPGLSWAGIAGVLAELAAVAGPRLLRAKGLFRQDGRALAIQMAGETLADPIPLAAPPEAPEALVVILRGMAAEAARGALAGIVAAG